MGAGYAEDGRPVELPEPRHPGQLQAGRGWPERHVSGLLQPAQGRQRRRPRHGRIRRAAQLPRPGRPDGHRPLRADEGRRGNYIPWTINQVSFGEAGAIYGVPQDIGPLALYYRKDLFEKAGIAVPTTWDEFYTAAKAIKAEGGLITNFPDAPSLFAGLAWQNGAQWFSNTDGQWKVSMTDEKTMQVADYWTKMAKEGLVDNKPTLSAVQYKAMDTGKEWSAIGAAWTAKLFETGVPTTSGKWAVAPLPQWTAGETKAGNWGGSTTVVFKGAKYPYEAAKFAVWAFGSNDAFALNNKNGGQYPDHDRRPGEPACPDRALPVLRGTGDLGGLRGGRQGCGRVVAVGPDDDPDLRRPRERARDGRDR